jgi:hypothetical protein
MSRNKKTKTVIIGDTSGVGLAAINGALERMIPVLAVELAPLRVNEVSPGVVDTPWSHSPGICGN